ncbi:MAG TPA: CCA tRNA nucleotidyltransferase [Methanomicrobiales archaeon]|nr:CCA tRNA nucleotidyltransferase [Methanomicrobiales archaeon]
MKGREPESGKKAVRPLHEEEVLARIRPKGDEHNHTWHVATDILAAVAEDGRAKGMVVGSVARDTWLSGEKDLDIFLLFPPGLPREELEEAGLDLARRIARRFAGDFREKYAEHPYVNATIDGLDVDLVPCYEVASAAKIQSAVDRTPFHTRYITGRIAPFRDEVLLAKQFAKACGVYGSDQMTEGFSGYLCELLVLYYGGFTPLLQAAAGWKPGTCIDLAGHACKAFEEPLRVVDPVDPARNVAAALSSTRMFEFVEYSRGYLEDPSPDFFFPAGPVSLGREGFARALARRGTCLYALTFPTPPLIPDIVVPQLRRSLASVRGLLSRHGFPVLQEDCAMGEERCILVLELLADQLPPVTRHTGPPLWDRENAAKFADKYWQNPLSGPFIRDGRYLVDLDRPFTDAGGLLRSPEVLAVGLGRHVKQSMEKGWEVHEGPEAWQEEFGEFLSRFIGPASPLARRKRGR